MYSNFNDDGSNNQTWFQWIPSFPSIFVTNNDNVNFYNFGNAGDSGYQQEYISTLPSITSMSNTLDTGIVPSCQNVTHPSSPVGLPEVMQRKQSWLKDSTKECSPRDKDNQKQNIDIHKSFVESHNNFGSKQGEKINHRLGITRKRSMGSKTVHRVGLCVLVFLLLILTVIVLSFYQNVSLGYSFKRPK